MSIRRALQSKRGFGVFWLGFSASVIGDAITRTTLIWYVLDSTGSSVSLGWLSFCFTAPVIIGGLTAGWLLDRYDRRTIIVIDSLTKSLLVVSVPILAALNAMPPWYVFFVASISGFLLMIPLAGVPSLLPRLVRSTHLDSANALETIGYTTGGVLGPPLAGLLIAHVGPLEALYVDAATYLAFAWAVSRCRPRATEDRPATTERAHLLDAVRIILQSPVLARTTSMYLVFNIGLGALLVVVPIIADTSLGGGPALYGLLLAGMAIGELISSVVIGSIRLRIARGLAICLALILSGIAVAALAISAQRAGIAIGLTLYGAFSAPLTIWGQSLRMKIIPPRFHGRCFALMRTLMQSGAPLGGVLAGFAVPVVNVRTVTAGIAIVTCLAGTVGLMLADLRRAR